MKTAQLIDALSPVIEEAVRTAVIEALTVEITWEKARDEKTGLPLAAVERVTEKVFLPAFFCQHLKFHEGAALGLHEDVSKKNNLIDDMAKKLEATNERLEAIGQALLGMETAAKTLAALSDRVKQRYPELLDMSRGFSGGTPHHHRIREANARGFDLESEVGSRENDESKLA